MMLVQDLRVSLRAFRHEPAFTLVVTLTLALGIGATTAIFAIIDAILLRPLPYPAPSALVKLFDVQSNNREVGALSYPEFMDWRERSGDVFDAVAAFASRGEVLSGVGDAEQLQGAQVSVELPLLLGVQPVLGRTFRREDEAPAGARLVMLSDRLWRNRFASDPAIVGRSVTLTGTPYEVIGVFPSTPSTILPAPRYMARGRPADFWEPLQLDARTAPRGLHNLDAIARVRSGVSFDQAAGRVTAIAAAIRKDRGTIHGLQIKPLASVLVGDLRAPLVLLLCAVGLLLLMTCANVANLLLARSAARQREFAVRCALGAPPARIVMLVAADCGIRAALGGACGVGLAWGIAQIARTALVGAIPRIASVAIDGRALAVAVGVAVFSAVLFGVAPALRTARRDVVPGLSGTRGVVAGVSRDAVRRALIVGEIALSFVLVAGAILLTDSYLQLLAVPTGFDPASLIAGRVWLPSNRYPDGAAQNAAFDRIAERIGESVGAEHVAFASDLPIAGGTYGGVGLDDPRFPDGAGFVEKRIVSFNYFEVLKAQLVRGRFFGSTDREGGQPVAIVNQTFARQWFEGKDPIGQRVAFAWGIDGFQTVVGVVADVREGGLAQQPKAAIYVTRAQRPTSDLHIIVRAPRAGNEVVNVMRASVSSVDRALPLIDVQSASDLIASTVRQRQLTTGVLVAFALSALSLAAIGLYALISYLLAQRTRELGIRAALGAQPNDLVWLVVTETFVWTATGIAIGVVAALIVSGLMSAQLFGVSPTDPRVYAITALVIVVVALVASARPTLRAAGANPLDVLRAM